MPHDRLWPKGILLHLIYFFIEKTLSWCNFVRSNRSRQSEQLIQFQDLLNYEQFLVTGLESHNLKYYACGRNCWRLCDLVSSLDSPRKCVCDGLTRVRTFDGTALIEKINTRTQLERSFLLYSYVGVQTTKDNVLVFALYFLFCEKATRRAVPSLMFFWSFAIVAEKSLIREAFEIGKICRSVALSVLGRVRDARSTFFCRCREHPIYYIVQPLNSKHSIWPKTQIWYSLNDFYFLN